MKKVIQFFNPSFFLPVKIIFFLYIWWLLTINVNESLVTGLILFPFYLIGMVFVKLLEKHSFFQLLLFFFLTLVIYKTRQFFGAELLFTIDVGIGSYIWGGILTITLFLIYLANIFEGFENKVRINRKTAISLFLFTFTLPLFTINFGYYFPKLISERARLGEYTYLIFETYNSDFHPMNVFYKCKRWEFECELLYGTPSATIGQKIIIDEQNKEVSLFDDVYMQFLYTDGENPRYYAFGTGGILNDHLYSLSEKCNNPNNDKGYYDCESYTYIPYKCNTAGVLCNPIPIRYTTNNNDGYYYWTENELQNEISLYKSDDIDDILIFTYGSHSRCYVDGCEILEQNN